MAWLGDLGDREDWHGFAAGTAGDAAYRAVLQDLQGGEMRLLGQVVGSPFHYRFRKLMCLA